MILTSYILTYDLIKLKDYQKLWDELKRMGAHRTLASVWLVASNVNAEQLVLHLNGYIDKDDKLWVLELTHNYQFRNALPGTNKWIEKHPPTR